MLKRIRHLIPKYTALVIYRSQIRSVLDYGDVIFDNASFLSKPKLDRVQREAVLTIARVFRRTPTISLLKDVGVEPLSIRRKIHRLTMFHKMFHRKCPAYLYNLVPSDTRSAYVLRPKGIPDPVTRTQRSRYSFLSKTIKEWNSLANGLQNSRKNIFIKYIKKMFSVDKANKLFYHGQEPAITHHTRLRLGLSHMRSHLYQFNIIEDPFCPHCPNIPETPMHFLLKCHKYSSQRKDMFHKLQQALNCDLTNKSSKAMTKMLLEGGSQYDYTTNCKIFSLVHLYMIQTERFIIKPNQTQ